MRLRTFVSTLICFAVVFSQAAPAAALTMRSDSRHMYVYRTFGELTEAQQAIAVADVSRVVLEKLSTLFPNQKFDSSNFDILENNQSLVQATIHRAKRYAEGIGASRLGFRAADLLPSAFIGTVGLRLSAASLIGAAGSLSLGFIVMPLHETTIDLLTGTTENSWSCDWTSVLLVNGGLGIGEAKGPSLAWSLGMIFGPMSQADEFTGTTASVSGALQLGVGVYTKIGALANPKLPGDFNFLFALFGASRGPAAEFTAHGNLGYVFGPAAVIRLGLSELGIEPQVTVKDLSGQVKIPAPPAVEAVNLQPETP